MRRRSKWGRLGACGFLFLLAGALVTAQQQPTIFKSDTRVVVCHTTVIDKSGHLITNLTKDAFT
ncbi:MAG TPA: hypothetical protein VMT32_19075, partial [Bryobacteraceae bacterium]|nr:hypothetical protein [Bryobacteraceae bacterium]